MNKEWRINLFKVLWFPFRCLMAALAVSGTILIVSGTRIAKAEDYVGKKFFKLNRWKGKWE